MRDIHAKEKKMLVEIVASQLNQQLQQFKEDFSKDWKAKLDTVQEERRGVSPSRKAGSNVLGVTRQEFIGTTVPITLRE